MERSSIVWDDEGFCAFVDPGAESAEELQQKYLTAMLGSQYKVSLDPESLVKSKSNQGVAYYILQRMAKEDSNITINNKGIYI